MNLDCPEDEPSPDPDIAIKVLAILRNVEFSSPTDVPRPLEISVKLTLENVPPELYLELRKRGNPLAAHKKVVVIFPPEHDEFVGPESH